MALKQALIVGLIIFGIIFIALAILPSLTSNGGNWFEQKYSVTGSVKITGELSGLNVVPKIEIMDLKIEKQILPFSFNFQQQVFAIGATGERSIICIDYGIPKEQCIESGNWCAGLGCAEAEWKKPFAFGGVTAGSHYITVNLYTQGVIVKSWSYPLGVS
jgi:hypothetical protein